MRILAIETSCDETAVAIIDINRHKLKILSENVASQVALHSKWGGVVPELAARRHAEVIIPLIDKTLLEAKTNYQKLDALAVTGGPGLITALQVGVETAKTLSWLWKKPLINVNHLEGHLASPFLANSDWSKLYLPSTWPAVALIVSGGHTELHLLTKPGKYKLIGRTLDDAAGEAFDKVAKMLHLGYPGGPKVSKLSKDGNTRSFNFPRPMLTSPNFNFSFAGLKTAVLYTLQKYQPKKITRTIKKNICASFQQAAIDTLVYKTIKATEKTRAKTLLLGGGVAANTLLRESLQTALHYKFPTSNYLISPLKYTGDNATMIAAAAFIKISGKNLKPFLQNWKKINAQANWELWN